MFRIFRENLDDVFGLFDLLWIGLAVFTAWRVPQIEQPEPAPATAAPTRVTRRPYLDPAGRAAVLDQVLLVVLLGRPERRRRDDLGRDRLPRSCVWARAFDSAAASACSGEWVKIAERYCVPTSQPWRFTCVGSCRLQKRSRRSA